MDALEFVRELKRMCDTHKRNNNCCNCGGYNAGGCTIKNLENLLPKVEKWSAEHPKVTNLDHVAEGLEKLGYKVDKSYLAHTCPVSYAGVFKTHGCSRSEIKCFDCKKWWEEEYKGEE